MPTTITADSIPVIHAFKDMYRGDTYIAPNDIYIDSRVDFTGCSAKLQLKKSRDDAALIEQTPTVVHTSATEIEVPIRFEYADTEAIPPGTYTIDIQITLTNGDRFTYRKGTIKVLNDITT